MTEQRLMTRIAAGAGAGARHGAIVWGIYGILEFCFDSVFPLLYEPSHVLTGWHWMIGGVLLFCYLMLGLAGGAAVGAAAGAIGWRPEVTRPAIGLMIVVLFCGQVFYRAQTSAGRDILMVGGMVGCLQLLTLIPRLRGGFLWRLAHPLVVAVLLAGFPVWRIAPSLEGDTISPTPAAGAGGGKPDVVMLIMDTVRANHTSVHGYERDTTPRLRELAAQATVYHRAVAAGNFSLTGHASLFSGSYPRRNGAHTGGSPRRALQPRVRTIAEYLIEQGYSTTLCSANHAFLTRYYGMVQGFQTYKTPNLLANSYHLRRIVRKLFQATRFWELQRKFSSAGTINQLVYEELDELTAAGSPFFLVVNYMDAHDPFVAPAPFTDIYLPGAPLMTNVRLHQLANLLGTHRGSPTSEELEIILAQYDAGIRYADEQIGELIAYLKRAGRFDNTLIIVTSDHGDTVMESDHYGHAHDVCELEVRIPLVLKYPHQTEPRVVQTYVSQVDMLPTILDVADAEVPVDIDGVSLARPGDDEDRKVVAEGYGRRGATRALYSGDWKLISHHDGTFQLFQIADDPAEQHNLFEAEPAKAAELVAALESWLAATPKFVPGTREVDEDELERLKGLGYIR